MAKAATKKASKKTKATTKPTTTKAKPKKIAAPATATATPTSAATAPAIASSATPAVMSATTSTTAPAPTKPVDFGGFLKKLEKLTDSAKLEKATSMLKAEKFRLYAKVESDHLVGVVKSQTNHELVYSCRLGSDGKYACCTQNLNICGGLRGSPCKHLLVLIVGLAKAGELDLTDAQAWTQAVRGKKPELDKEAMTQTFLTYKGAEAGTVDWRPTETIPEDFYAM